MFVHFSGKHIRVDHISTIADVFDTNAAGYSFRYEVKLTLVSGEEITASFKTDREADDAAASIRRAVGI